MSPLTLADGLHVWEAPLRMLGIEVGRRMTVVTLADGSLAIHSPAELTPAARAWLETLGQPRYVVPASLLHGHLFMEQYAGAYPALELFAAPGLPGRRTDLRFAGVLGASPEAGWAAALDQTLFEGNRALTEVVFLHRSSATLIVGDLVWNNAPPLPLPARVWGGVRRRVAPTPAFRLAIRDRAAARRSLDRILSWDFDRIVVGHGPIVERGGREALARAYDWL